MEPVSVLPLKDHIIEILRREIFSGRMENGLELTQESVADQLKVSRIPVREAFLQLESEGMLERLPNRHVRVVGITTTRLWQNFHVLAAIEAEIALQLVSEGKLSDIGEAFNKCKAVYDQKEWSQLRKEDRAFHLCLSEALDNHTLRQLHEIQHRVLFSGVMDQLKPDWDKVIALDEAIWRAVRTRDGIDLRRAIYEYYTVLAQDAVKELSQ